MSCYYLRHSRQDKMKGGGMERSMNQNKAIEFNKESRKKNALRMSGMGLINQLISNIAAFVYRTVFIYLLSVEYFGINGLFTNIIQIFSLAELGIGNVIIFRLYKPIKDEDINRTAALMHFYKAFYRFIALLIISVSIILIPFLPYIIKDPSEIPSDVNLYVVYILYVLESACSYTFIYRQALLDADQKGYISTAVQMTVTCLRYAVSILLLYMTRNYTLVLSGNLLVRLAGNMWIYWYASRKYSAVFKNTSRLDKKEILQICKDTGAMMCHRIGSTVVTSTDNIIMSAYVGTVAVGIYSNYYMLIQAVQNIISNFLGSFTASLGNHIISVEAEERYLLYKRLYFINMWVSVFCTSSLFLLLNPFIQIVWGKELIFSKEIVIILCINFYLFSSRIVNGSFGNAAGMFRYDRIRPLVEAILNLSISIVLAIKLEVAGVFLGTILSSLFTVWWREPYLLYKKVFNQKIGSYFFAYFSWTLLLLITVIPLDYMFSKLPLNVLYLFLRFVICGLGINLFFVILFHRNSSFLYFWKFGKTMLAAKILPKQN